MKNLQRHLSWILILVATSVNANDGGTVSPFSFGAGARDLSLGGAAIAESDFVTAPYWNASALARAEQYSLTGFHSTLYDSDVAYQYLGLVVPTLDFGCFGVGIFRLGVSGIEQRDAGNLLLGTIDDSRLSVNLAYGNTLSGYNIGVAVTMEHHSLGTYKATSSPGINLALGKRLEIGSGRLDHISMTLAGRNLLQPRFNLSGTNVSYPVTVVTGISIGLKPNPKWDHSATLSASLTKIDWVDPRLAVGLEYSFQNLLQVRGGIRDGRLGFGVGLNYRSISFDYALVDRDLGSLHMFSLNTVFGKSTSERRKLEVNKREKHFNELMSTHLLARSRKMIAEQMESGRRHLEDDDLAKASSNFDRALIIARSNHVDTTQIHELVYETARRLKEMEHIHRLGQFLDSARTSLEQEDYFSARYHAGLALAEEPGSVTAERILIQSTAAIDELSSKESLIDQRLQTADSLLNYGQVEQASSIVNSLQPFADDYPRINLTIKRVVLEKWKARASAAFNQQENELAIEMLDSALTLFPGHRWCLNMRSQAVEKMRYSVAANIPESQPETKPLSNRLRKEVRNSYRSAQDYFEKGNLTLAIESWEKVDRMAPNYQSVRKYLVNAYKFVGIELYNRDQLREAVAIWKKALALVPSNKEINSYVTRTETEIRKLQELSYESE